MPSCSIFWERSLRSKLISSEFVRCSLQMHMRYTHVTSHTLDTPLTAHEMPADMAAVKLVITPLHPSSSEDFLTCIVWIYYVHGSSSLWFRPTAKRLDSWWNGMRGTSNLTIPRIQLEPREDSWRTCLADEVIISELNTNLRELHH